ncbi:MAG: polysulfide reductase NrfD [Deinococcota bacterium]|nr:polysulfide reductase NrfD [Deinococcota bacterium]
MKANQGLDEGRILAPGYSYGSVEDTISSIPLTDPRRTPRWWIGGFAVAFLLLMVFLFSVTYLIAVGIGIWGVNQPVGWGFDIINFVWWIGIGHAGTLISAILLLVRQQWRTSINRFAEAMTLFAVACAGVYPLLHLGRPWVFYWLFPYPNQMGLWPQFNSPLIWDVFAVSTYATVSLLFWYVGLIPDLATLRDVAKNRWARTAYAVGALGWTGSARHWNRYTRAYLLLAALSTPLVLSVHSVVSFDFAISQLPGWHNTVFPPYFVAGAVFAGFAMVIILAIPLRKFYGLEGIITMKHLDNMAKIILATGTVVTYGYVIEIFTAWYSGSEFERYMALNRLFGPYGWVFWALIFCNFLTIQLFWFKSIRYNLWALFIVSIIVSVGMWLERFVIIVMSLHRDFLPSSWGMYAGTFWDWATFIGTMGLFFTLFFVFIRVLPLIAISEMKELVHHEEGHKH